MSAHRADPTAAVVVCAYTERRWDDLLAAVASARAQVPAPLETVVVVDHHPGLADRARDAFVGAGEVVVLENHRRRGLSGARNTALAHLGARADVVAFLDDDAAARPGWLAALLAPYADDAVVAVGGVAIPRWPGAGASGATGDEAGASGATGDEAGASGATGDEGGASGATGDEGGASGDAPAVLPGELWWVVGCTFTGQFPAGVGAAHAVEVRNLMGCSMSFRAKVFADVGGFDENMGRVGAVPLGGEETELCLRLRVRVPGARIVLTPVAVVDHRVSPDRVTWRYLRRRAFAEGLSKAVLARRAGAGDGLATERAYTRAVLPAGVRRELAAAGRAVGAGRGAEAGARLRSAAAVPLALGAAALGFVRGHLATGPGDRGVAP